MRLLVAGEATGFADTLQRQICDQEKEKEEKKKKTKKVKESGPHRSSGLSLSSHFLGLQLCPICSERLTGGWVFVRRSATSGSS